MGLSPGLNLFLVMLPKTDSCRHRRRTRVGGDVLGYYCALLYQRFGKFEDVAKYTDLNWRTAKKYIQSKI